MSKVKTFFKAPAGKTVEIEAATPQDGVEVLGLSGNFTAVLDGEPADMDTQLSEGSFVVLAKSVKGGVRKIIVNTETLKVVRDGAVYIINGQQGKRSDLKAMVNALLDALGYETI